MWNPFERFTPRDVLALSILLFLFIAKFAGFNGIIDPAIALIIGYYFGRRQDFKERPQ